LDISAVSTAADTANAALETFEKGIEAWTVPLDVNSKREELETLGANLDAHLVAVAGYVDIAELIASKEDKATKAAKKQAKCAVESVSQKVSRGGCPGGVSRVMGGLLCEYLKQGDGRAMFASSVYPFELSWSDQKSYQDVFLLPRGIRPDGAVHHWQSELGKVLTTEAVALKEKASAVAKKMDENQNTHGSVTFQPKSENELAWNPAGQGAGPFEVATGMRPHLLTIVAGAYENSRQSQPMSGCGMFMSVVEGTAAILFVGGALAEKEDLAHFLASAGADAFKKEPACVLSANESAWIPFGWNPVVFGVPSHLLDNAPKVKCAAAQVSPRSQKNT